MPLVGKKVHITTNDFGNMVRKGYLMVDKTLMIRDFIDGEQVSLITRPRRFGKTLNMSMLHHFFAPEIDREPTQGLFNGLAIASERDEEGQKYLEQYQGQYPVISITFKDAKGHSFNEVVASIKTLIQELYRQHQHHVDAETLSEADTLSFNDYLHGCTDTYKLKPALFYLSEFLHKVHKKKVIILIDEYDSPLTAAYEHQYLDELSDFIRDMLSSALKDNRHLEKGLMTGILRVSQSSMLSGLNNLKTYTLLDEQYGQYFGFTETEVSELMAHLGITESLASIRRFYNGYQIGTHIVYNPWSLMNYLSDRSLQPYWVLTSNDKLLKELLLNSSQDVKEKLSHLIQGDAIEAQISINLRYEELMEDPGTLWTLLLFCGYLTVEAIRFEEDDPIYQLKIPNHEVWKQYKTVFTAWLKQVMGSNQYVAFLNDLIEGRIASFIQKLTTYLLSCTSTHDFHHESHYHTFVLGLVSALTATHYISSNKETGIGRPDLVLIPKDPHQTQGFILEFKHVDHKKQPKANRLHLPSLRDDGRQAVIQALQQIHARAYEACFLSYPYITEVVRIGIGFTNRLVSAGSITTPRTPRIDLILPLNEQAITFYDAHDNHDET